MEPALTGGDETPLAETGLSRTRTRVRRVPEKARPDRPALDAVLAAGRVAHVGIVGEQGQPFVLPVGYAPAGDDVLLHGSTASRLFRVLADGAPACLTVTLYDGLVLARSAFESSMHYRSAMVLGSCAPVPDADKAHALRRLSEHLMPGRWDDVRPPSRKELAATLVLRLPLAEWSVKVSDGPPADDAADLDVAAWAGVVPIREVLGDPVPAPTCAGNPPCRPTCGRGAPRDERVGVVVGRQPARARRPA